MTVYYSKESLYNKVAEFKTSNGFDSMEYNIDLLSLCNDNCNLELRELNFSSKAFRGVAVFGDNNEKDIILLNQNRNYIEKSFDCGHEVMHLALHRYTDIQTFNCIEGKVQQNPFYEWQANEGSAEFFVPYRVLLPMIKDRYSELHSWNGINSFKLELERQFGVTQGVVHYRLESLKYEINQCISGTPLNEIKILSQAQQRKDGIKVLSLNDLEMYFLKQIQ